MQNYSNLKELKLLLVEDEQKLSKFLKEGIKEYFASLTLAKDGFEGIKKFKRVNPDIVITDILMPNLDGLEMAEELKSLKPSVHIIVLSAFSHKEKLLKAIDLGINKYFIKPFDTEELLNYIQSVASKIKKAKLIPINGAYEFDKNSKTLYHNSNMIKLTQREKEFIHLLINNPSKVTSTKIIKRTLWGKENDITQERVRTFIKRLRQKTSKSLIENISGQGYILSKNDG